MDNKVLWINKSEKKLFEKNLNIKIDPEKDNLYQGFIIRVYKEVPAGTMEVIINE